MSYWRSSDVREAAERTFSLRGRVYRGIPTLPLTGAMCEISYATSVRTGRNG
jgi:hypothetical protein